MQDSSKAWLDKPLLLSHLTQESYASYARGEFRNLERVHAKPVERGPRSHNIYSDIFPFRETGIKVGKPEDGPDRQYINANRIRSIYGEANDVNLMIAAQGPIAQSRENFWRMVLQERVGMIVTLVH